MYANLEKMLKKREITIKMLAACLHTSQLSIRKKLEGGKDFTIEEAFLIKCYFFPDIALSFLFQKHNK